MWALGVLLYHFLSGSYPFEEPTLRRLMETTASGDYALPNVIGASTEEERFTLAVLGSLLNPDPNRRFRIGQLRTVIDDALYRKVIPALVADSALWVLYFKYGGDIWVCPRCFNLVHPSGPNVRRVAP
jgi:serine/threonine protein kinase